MNDRMATFLASKPRKAKTRAYLATLPPRAREVKLVYVRKDRLRKRAIASGEHEVKGDLS